MNHQGGWRGNKTRCELESKYGHLSEAPDSVAGRAHPDVHCCTLGLIAAHKSEKGTERVGWDTWSDGL